MVPISHHMTLMLPGHDGMAYVELSTTQSKVSRHTRGGGTFVDTAID